MFTLSVWAWLLLPITDGRTYGRLSWVLFFLATFLVCNGDKILGVIYWSINPQISTVTKLRCRSGETVVRRKKVTGIRKMEYGNCQGITYLRTTKAVRGKLKPHTAKDEEWSYRICAIGRTLNITSSKIMADYESRSRLLGQLYYAYYPTKATSCKGGVSGTSTPLQGLGLPASFPGGVGLQKIFM